LEDGSFFWFRGFDALGDAVSAREEIVIQVLSSQFDIVWKLTRYHLESLTTDECLWRPAPVGLHVQQLADGRWRADWPEREDYDTGPPSIAWVTWHVVFWWSMVLDHSFGPGRRTREDVFWPGSADAVREEISRLAAEWRGRLHSLTGVDAASTERTRWPFRDRPFADVVAWVNLELMKNAAEIGYIRFLYATRTL
jgi:hypothetical protein